MGRALVVVGLGFGDEGKGGIVDFLTRKHNSKLTVRFNGGAQASHAVVTEDGRDHRFSQFGSGTFFGARTFLSNFMLVNPTSLVSEARHLIELGVPDPYKLLTIDGDAMMTTPFHIAANRIREMARSSRHGSCGMGIGETRAYDEKFGRGFSLVAGDLECPSVVRGKLTTMCQLLKAEVEPFYDPARPDMTAEWEVFNFDETMAVFQPYLDRVYKHVEIVGSEWLDRELVQDQTVVFEGAQGVLLDENYGFHPYTTWSTTTFEWAERLVRRTEGIPNAHVEMKKIGVLRGYHTRHGAGPFPSEDKSIPVPEGEHNGNGPWQADFRMGHFDMVLARYAMDVCGGVDELALTCLDHLKGPFRVCRSYKMELDPPPPGGLHRRQLYTGGLKAQRPTSLALQEAMGQDLMKWTPGYEEFSGVEHLVDYVERDSKTPVKTLSFGPKSSDKKPRG